MTTPIEDQVIAAMSERLRVEGLDDGVIASIKAAYEASTLPSVEQILNILRSEPADKAAGS